MLGLRTTHTSSHITLACPPGPQLLTYVKEGDYLNRQLTDFMTAEALVFNPTLLVFGYWRGTFTWAQDSFITLTQQFEVCELGVGTVGAVTGCACLCTQVNVRGTPVCQVLCDGCGAVLNAWRSGCGEQVFAEEVWDLVQCLLCSI